MEKTGKIRELTRKITSSKTVRLVSIITILVSTIILLSACRVEEDSSTYAEKMLAKFKTTYITGEDPVLIAQKMIDSEILPFSAAVIPAEPGFLNGFSTEISGFKRGAAITPEIGAIPFIAYIFEMDDIRDIDAFIDKLETAADLRWNVCTQADEMRTGSSGNGVFIVMSPIDL